MASVLGHMTVTRQYITRNLNPESSLTFFVCAAAPSVTRDVRAERAPAVGCRAHADEGARAGRRHVPGPTEREAAPRRAAERCAWLVVAEGDLRGLRHHGEVRTARRPDGRALLQVRECEVRLEGRPAHLARVELGRDQLEQRVSLAANEVVLF